MAIRHAALSNAPVFFTKQILHKQRKRPPANGRPLKESQILRAASAAQIGAEEGNGARPGEIGGFLVVASPAGVVVEGVVDAFIHVDGVALARRLQRFFIGRDARD